METIRAKVLSAREFTAGFRILTLRHAGGEATACGVVHFDGSVDGVFLTLEGKWCQHPRYGRQFSFDQCTIEGSEIWFFLSRMVAGVGDALATVLVDTFGDELLEHILDNEPERLLAVKGIKEKKLAAIVTSWRKNAPLRQLSRKLTPHGVHGSMIIKIYSWFGEQSVGIVTENPYKLTEIPGIGFRRADDLALKLGLDPSSSFRIDSCVEFCLDRIGNETGDTLVAMPHLEEILLAELCHEDQTPEPALVAEVGIRLQLLALAGNIVVIDGLCASCGNFSNERRIFEILLARQSLPAKALKSPGGARAHATAVSAELGFDSFSAEQAAAIDLAATGVKTLAVCGYAGTGKSTVARAILTLLAAAGSDGLVCTALSGIAADRIRKVTGYPAMTIHSLLKWNGSTFEYGPKNPLPYRVILVDECSMINSWIFRQLLEAVSDDCVLLLLGDTAQLAPIGPGNAFYDLVNGGLCPTVELTRIYRQANDSVLVDFANQVRLNRVPQDFGRSSGYRDFHFIPREIDGWFRLKQQLPEPELQRLREANQHEVLQVVRSKILAIAAHIDDPLSFFQILSPQRAGLLGTENLNRVCQEILNPPVAGRAEVVLYGNHFRLGDKVVHIKNKRDMPFLKENDWAGAASELEGAAGMLVYNGTLGIIVAVDEESRAIIVRYPPGIVVRYDYLLAGDLLEHAFCLTVHKVQGSEFTNVLLPIVSQHWRMMNAQWLYTALTRASRRVVCVGHSYVFEHACKTAGGTRRSTVLSRLACEATTS